MEPVRVMYVVTQEKQSLKVPEKGPEPLRRLCALCINRETESRPTISEISKVLAQIPDEQLV
jgi:hypothetical protein